MARLPSSVWGGKNCGLITVVMLYSLKAARKPRVMDLIDVQPVEAHFYNTGCMLEPVRHSPSYARE